MKKKKNWLKDQVKELLDLLEGISTDSADEEPDNEELDAEQVTYELLFLSPAGKNYATDIQDAIFFTARGIALTCFPGIQRLLNKFYTFPRLATIIEQAEGSKEDKEAFLSIHSALKRVELPVDETVSLFTSEDNSRFIANLIISVYAYCEVFVEDVITRAFGLPSFGKKYLSYLEKTYPEDFPPQFRINQLQKDLRNPEAYIKERSHRFFVQKEKKNPFDRMKRVLAVLQLRGQLQGVFCELEVHDYIQKFKKFKANRDKIAHGEPAPSLDLFDSAEFEQQLDEQLRIFDEQSTDTAPKEVKELLQILKDEISNIYSSLQKPFAVIHHLIQDAIVLPAIVDRIIERWEFHD